MKAVCRYNSSSRLADHHRGRFSSIESTYPLTVGGEYVVVGMGIWENVLSYLVCDDIGVPTFAPSGLFDPEDVEVIPPGWEFALRGGISAEGTELWTNPCAAVWGYHELVADPSHAGALEEGDDEARAIFREALRRQSAP